MVVEQTLAYSSCYLICCCCCFSSCFSLLEKSLTRLPTACALAADWKQICLCRHDHTFVNELYQPTSASISANAKSHCQYHMRASVKPYLDRPQPVALSRLSPAAALEHAHSATHGGAVTTSSCRPTNDANLHVHKQTRCQITNHFALRCRLQNSLPAPWPARRS